jgi:hypothetical protein
VIQVAGESTAQERLAILKRLSESERETLRAILTRALEEPATAPLTLKGAGTPARRHCPPRRPSGRARPPRRRPHTLRSRSRPPLAPDPRGGGGPGSPRLGALTRAIDRQPFPINPTSDPRRTCQAERQGPQTHHPRGPFVLHTSGYGAAPPTDVFLTSAEV